MRKTDRFTQRLTLGIAAIIVASTSIQAQAFCIHNQTDTRLFFMVEPSSTDGSPAVTFEKWIEPGKSECCDWSTQTRNPSTH